MPHNQAPRFRRNVAATASVVVVAISWFILQPESEVVIDYSCSPESAVSKTRAFIQGHRFWEGQVNLIDRYVQTLERQPTALNAAQAEVDAAVQQAREQMELIYRKHPELRPSPAQTSADALRDKADAIEHAELEATLNRFRIERIQKLSGCRETIANRLR